MDDRLDIFGADTLASPRPAAAPEREAASRSHAQLVELYRDEIRRQDRALLQAYRDVEAARDEFALFFDGAPNGYVSLDGNGVVRASNLAFLELVGSERARVEGKPFLFLTERADHEAFLQHVLACRRRGFDRAEVRLRGSGLPVEIQTRKLREHSLTDVLFLCSVRDLSALRAAEDAHRQAEAQREEALVRERESRAATEARDRFLAMLSHELRTPLTPVLATISALEARADLPSGVRALLESARRNVESEARMIDDLLDLARIERERLRLDPEVLDLNALVREAVHDLAPGRALGEVALEVRTAPGAAPACVDGQRLRQVLANLLRNAVRACGRRGRVEVATRRDGDAWEVTVRDDGRGLDPTELATVFDAFERGSHVDRADGGLGLGLAISHGIVAAHGGRLAAESDGRGRGAAFRFRLPAATTAPAPARHGPPFARAPAATAGRRVLLVEDHDATATTLALLLEHHGYRVTVAGSVSEALERAGDGFDVCVSDLGLPDGSGCDLLRRLRARGDRLPALALSGYGAPRDVDEAVEAGFRGHLTKPVALDALIRAIEETAEG